jgi:hypothetical protein
VFTESLPSNASTCHNVKTLNEYFCVSHDSHNKQRGFPKQHYSGEILFVFQDKYKSVVQGTKSSNCNSPKSPEIFSNIYFITVSFAGS